MSDTKKLRALAEAATQGRWVHVRGGYVCVVDAGDEGEWRRILHDAKPDDAAYIAAVSPEVVIALIERVETLEEQVAAAGYPALTYKRRALTAQRALAAAETRGDDLAGVCGAVEVAASLDPGEALADPRMLERSPVAIVAELRQRELAAIDRVARLEKALGEIVADFGDDEEDEIHEWDAADVYGVFKKHVRIARAALSGEGE